MYKFEQTQVPFRVVRMHRRLLTTAFMRVDLPLLCGPVMATT